MEQIIFIAFIILMSIIIAFIMAIITHGIGAVVVKINDKIRERKLRHIKRFRWYREVGLLESSILIEPKVAKEYCVKWNGDVLVCMSLFL